MDWQAAVQAWSTMMALRMPFAATVHCSLLVFPGPRDSLVACALEAFGAVVLLALCGCDAVEVAPSQVITCLHATKVA